MARLLGRYQVPGCCPGTRAGWEPGPDCSGGGSMGRRAAKRAEMRLVLVEIEDDAGRPVVFDDHELAVIGMYEGECQHGCNGSPSCGSEQCTFICHPAADD